MGDAELHLKPCCGYKPEVYLGFSCTLLPTTQIICPTCGLQVRRIHLPQKDESESIIYEWNRLVEEKEKNNG